MAKKKPKTMRASRGAKKKPTTRRASRGAKKSMRSQGTTPEKKTGWTVMVFMAASKDDGETERAAIRDLREMGRVDPGPVNVVVQIDRVWPGSAERYLIRKDEVTPISVARKPPSIVPLSGVQRNPADRTSSGNPNVLLNFLEETRERFPDQNYLLVLWGHSFGLGFGRDHGDALTIHELSTALESFAATGEPLELLGTNACAMAYVEAVFELRNAAQYMIASELTMPFSGWPFGIILQRLAQEPTMPARALGEVIVKEFVKSYNKRDVSLSLIDLAMARKAVLPDALAALAGQLSAGLTSADANSAIVEAFLDTAHGDVRPLIDVTDLCTRLEVGGQDAGIASAAERLRMFVEPNKTNGLVVIHEFDTDLDGLNGLGIFAPGVASAADLARLGLHEEEYRALALMVLSQQKWSGVVYTDLVSALGDTGARLAELISESGASTNEERDGIGQLLLSVGRQFLQIERALDSVAAEIDGVGGSKPSKLRVMSTSSTAVPFLRLLPDIRQRSRAVARNGAIRKSAIDDSQIDLVRAFGALETAVANAESTLRKVVTNGSFGLGPLTGPGGMSLKFGLGTDPKPGLGTDPKPGLGTDPKPGLLEVDPKPGLLEVDPKPGFLDTDPKPGFLDTDPKPGLRELIFGGASSAMVGSVELFALIATSLRGIEDALAALEVAILSTDASVTQERQKDNARRALANFKEQLASAREATFWVVRHPTLGLGPGSIGLTSRGRQYLASRAGFSTRHLRLL